MAAALAEKGVQMSPTGLSKIETQSRMVSDIELVAIAEVLGVSVERLLTE
ncbi:MAG: helix-turn-helix domain-containing protein [Lachnospiraceae bacterium]|nr:helix-turn-helix transcriptional regulator [Acutalibacteraceae bacterium]